MRAASLLAILFASVLSMVRPVSAATEIPCAYRDGMIWLRVGIAGQTTPLNFLLDSGAGASVLNLDAARRLRLKLGRRETVQGVQGRCAAYRVDGFVADTAGISLPPSMLALDLNAATQGCGRRVDGLLGVDFFRGKLVQIDYAAGKIRLLGRDEAPASGAQILPLAARNDALCVRVGVADHEPEWMRLDTGCNSALEWVASGAKERKSARTSVAAATGSGRSLHADVILGSERLPGVTVGMHDQPMFPGESGLLGNGVLAHFLVTVDTAGSRLLLSRIK